MSPQMTETRIEPQDAFGLIRSFTRHVGFVKLAIHSVADALERRAMVHDLSKMKDDEFAGFSRINAAARINKFGSPEYSEGMRREKSTIDLHFSRNSHHAERSGLLMDADPDTHVQMDFLDIIEMVCDWWGAGKGYDDPRAWEDSVKLNIENKGKYLNDSQIWLVNEVAAFIGKELGND